MIVSHNEIITTVNQVLEALGLPQGQREEAAEMVAWRERHGLPGVEPLVKQIQAGCIWPWLPPNRLTVVQGAAGFDGRGRSALIAGPPVVDWVYNAARGQGEGRAVLRHCRNPALLMGYAVRTAGRGMGVMLRWGAPTGSRSIFFVRPGGQPVLASSGGRLSTGRLDIAVGINDSSENWLPHDGRVDISTADFDRRHQRHRTNGIAIPKTAFNFLKDIGKGVLVPASERSRKGAGE